MMLKEVGSKTFPIWLLGDSNPLQWQVQLQTPFDPRHPIRHNIWTSILDVIQDRVYREFRGRIDTTQLYIRNAIEDASFKPRGNLLVWPDAVTKEIQDFQTQLWEYHPLFIFCFGAFAFEFARRSLGEEPAQNFVHWGARRLGEEFKVRLSNFDNTRVNLIPLLHRSISGGKFIQSHDYFCGTKGMNYFMFVGNQISNVLIEHRETIHIWIP